MIDLVTTWDAYVNALGGAAMLAFGVWVLTLTPRSRSTKMLALFAIAAGLLYVPENLIRWTGWELFAVWNPYLTVLYAIGGLALVGLAHALVEPAGERGRRLWSMVAAAVLAGLVVLPVTAELLLRSTPFAEAGPVWWHRLSMAGAIVGNLVFFAAFVAVGFVLAWRYRDPNAGSRDTLEETHTRLALMSGALAIWPAFQAGSLAMGAADPGLAPGGELLAGVTQLSAWLALAGVWLVNARGSPEDGHRARNVSPVILGALLVGMLARVFVRPHFSEPSNGPLWGVVRLLTVLVLGYALLRHQVLGIEAKYRWGVSKTTVAGVFIATFFVVSEGAQVLFAGFAGSELLGIIAAGALLFALSPIQRLADRIAETAVPTGGTGSADTAEVRYRTAVEVALADGEITRDEEHRLAELADELDLDATRALEIQEAVEETGGGDDG